MADARPGIVIQPRVLAVACGVGAIGIAALALFLWMVPNAAAREAVAACRGLHGDLAVNEALCGNTGKPCMLPIPAPDFTAYDSKGKPVHLSDFRGKVVLLNFWASWCGVCRTEKPLLADMADEMAGDDFVVIALASDRQWSDVLRAITEALAPNVHVAKTGDPMKNALEAYGKALPNGTAFKVFLDPPAGDDNIGQIAASWGIKAVPESALIDRNGNIRAYVSNKRDWTSDVAETCLRSLIDERAIEQKDP
jgi:thiol-disulfide isomerase/thioredoxin